MSVKGSIQTDPLLWVNSNLCCEADRAALLWVIMQPLVVISYLHMGTTLNPEEGTDRLSQKSVWNYHYTLRNNPEQRSSDLLSNYSSQRPSHLLFCQIWFRCSALTPSWFFNNFKHRHDSTETPCHNQYKYREMVCPSQQTPRKFAAHNPSWLLETSTLRS